MGFHAVAACGFCTGSFRIWILAVVTSAAVPHEEYFSRTGSGDYIRNIFTTSPRPFMPFTSLKLIFTVMALFLFPLLEYSVSGIRKDGEHDSSESPGLSPLFQDWCAGKTELCKPLRFVSAANPSACVMFQVLDEIFLLENYCFTEMLPPFLLPPSFLPACHLW